MQLRCDKCGKMENFRFLAIPDSALDTIIFDCGYTKRETMNDLRELMRNYGGER